MLATTLLQIVSQIAPMGKRQRKGVDALATVFATATALLSVEKSTYVRPRPSASVRSDKEEEKRMMKNDANQRDAEECRACKIRLCCRRRSVVR